MDYNETQFAWQWTDVIWSIELFIVLWYFAIRFRLSRCFDSLRTFLPAGPERRPRETLHKFKQTTNPLDNKHLTAVHVAQIELRETIISSELFRTGRYSCLKDVFCWLLVVHANSKLQTRKPFCFISFQVNESVVFSHQYSSIWRWLLKIVKMIPLFEWHWGNFLVILLGASGVVRK